jgi:hypothetical protein
MDCRVKPGNDEQTSHLFPSPLVGEGGADEVRDG